MEKEDLKRLEQNDMAMIQWIYGVILSDRLASEKLREHLSFFDSITDAVQIEILKWFKHVERMG